MPVHLDTQSIFSVFRVGKPAGEECVGVIQIKLALGDALGQGLHHFGEGGVSDLCAHVGACGFAVQGKTRLTGELLFCGGEEFDFFGLDARLKVAFHLHHFLNPLHQNCGRGDGG